MAGPEIRGWSLAEAFAERHDVAVADRRSKGGSEGGIRLLPDRRLGVMREAARSDVVIAPFVPPYALAAVQLGSGIAVSDQYDPIELELGTLPRDRSIKRHLGVEKRIRRLQLRFADVVLCAGSRQAAQVKAELRDGRIHHADWPAVHTMPFGIPPSPPPSAERPLRARFSIAPEDPVVLWWGSIWRWLDADGAIRAFGRVLEKHPRAKLVVTAGRPPAGDTERQAATYSAKETAATLGLLDRSVFFLEEWVEYSRRHAFLADADVGLTLHRNTPEARLAARSRYADYLWTSTPCVLAEGDELADQLAQGGLATLVAAGDEEATAAALDRLLSSPEARSRARESGRRLADSYRWPRLTAPAVRCVEQTWARRRRQAGARPWLAAANFYAVRAMQKTRDTVT